MTTASAFPGVPHPEVATVEVPKLERVGPFRLRGSEWLHSAPFLSVHVAALIGAILVPPTWGLIGLCVGLYYVRLLAISLGFHRYFAHRTYKTSRAFQFVLAFWGMTTEQRGVLWWAGVHRNHHKLSDQPDDVHSPARSGFWWSHVGWLMAHRNEPTPIDDIRDMARFPELRWLDRHHYVPGLVLAVALFGFGGWPALVWGFFVSTVLCWHGTFTINSLSHVYGRRRYPTTDTSRNNFWLSLLTLGEGWHNNHHYFCSSARLGFFWWEIDPTWWFLRLLEKLGIVWDVKTPPPELISPT